MLANQELTKVEIKTDGDKVDMLVLACPAAAKMSTVQILANHSRNFCPVAIVQ